MTQSSPYQEAVSATQFQGPLLRAIANFSGEIWCLISLADHRVIECSRLFRSLWEMPVALSDSGVSAFSDDSVKTVRAAGGYREKLPLLGAFVELMEGTGAGLDETMLCDAFSIRSYVVLDDAETPIGKLVFLMSQPHARELSDNSSQGLHASHASHALDILSPREREILDLLYDGVTNRGISRQLKISEKTVEKHRSNVMSKLSVRDFAHLIRVVTVARFASRNNSERKTDLSDCQEFEKQG